MQGFINNIVSFLFDIIDNVRNAFYNESLSWRDYLNTWFNKNVFMDNSLIGLNLTWLELLSCLGTFILIILFLYLIIRLFCSFLKIFEL